MGSKSVTKASLRMGNLDTCVFKPNLQERLPDDAEGCYQSEPRHQRVDHYLSHMGQCSYNQVTLLKTELQPGQLYLRCLYVVCNYSYGLGITTLALQVYRPTPWGYKYMSDTYFGDY